MGKKTRKGYEPLDTDLTPMIDVCFQLIIFFMLILSIKQVYGIAIKFPPNLPPQKQKQKQEKPIFIWVGPDRYVQGHQVLQEGYIKLNGEPIALGVSPDSASRAEEHARGMKYLYEKLNYYAQSDKPVYDTVMTVSGEVNSYQGKIVEVVDQGKKAELKGFNMAPPQLR